MHVHFGKKEVTELKKFLKNILTIKNYMLN